METRKSEELARAIRELAGLLVRAGRPRAAEVLDEEAGPIAAGVPPRGLDVLRRTNAIHTGLAEAKVVSQHGELPQLDRTRVAALADDIRRALSNN